MKKISIIVPIYNSEKTIRRCLDSIKNQTRGDFECLIIDDGSTDNSAKICVEYVREDQRFKLFSKSNGGPSSARNLGIDNAKGDYIAFVDSDDYVATQYIELILDEIEKHHPDAIFISYSKVDDKGDLISERLLPEQYENYYDTIFSLDKNDMFGYTWIKIIRREVIGKSRFDETLNLREDEVFACEVFTKHMRLCLLRIPLYFYVRGNRLSLSGRMNPTFTKHTDAVYKAWKKFCAIADIEYSAADKLLAGKSEHFKKICYYYAMERDVDVADFCGQLAECSFINDFESKDIFIDLVRKRKWKRIRIMRFIYSLKTAAYKLKSRIR